jgi:site-specific recombinase XerD
VSLKRRADGLYELIDEKTGPISDASRFLHALALRGLSAATVRAYGFDLVAVYRWMFASRRTLRRLEARHLLDFIATQQGAQPSSINRRLTTCRLLYRFCTDRELDGGPGYFGGAPHYRGRGKDRDLGLHALRRPRRLQLRVKMPRRVVEPLTAVEVRRFLGTLRRYRDLAIVYLMLFCGLRSGEVLHVRLADVSFDERELRVHGKGNKERLLPLPDLVLQSLVDYLRWERPATTTDHLFVALQGKRRGQPMRPAGLRSLFRHRRRARQIARANPHRFRHTFGADMARAGVRLPILQRMMGHAHAITTLRYIHLSMSDVADAYQRAMQEIAKRYRRD